MPDRTRLNRTGGDVRRPSARILAVLAVAILAAGLAGCGDDDGDDATGATTTSTASTTTATTAPPATEIEARVYFVRDEAVAAAGRTVAGPAVGRAALDALLDGPRDLEADLGMTSAVPEGTEVLGLDVADGTATVDLSDEFQSGGGSLSMQARVAQVVFTLTQFPEVELVTIHLDGEPVDAVGGEGVPAVAVSRDDFANVTPAILVEEPTPGQAVASPLVVEGTANVFEGNVEWTLADPDGRIVDEGFTTAAAEEVGAWGPFTFSVDFSVERDGLGSIVVFSTSAEDGSRQDIVEIPIRMAAG